MAGCVFCSIIAGETPAAFVLEDELTVAFLDARPVFRGHTLLVPRAHHETLADLPRELLEPLFANAQLVARAIEDALGADGSFVGMNNRVSQSVPHLHVHMVPRKRKDGLRGFFWPRQKYASETEMTQTAAAISAAVERMRAR